MLAAAARRTTLDALPEADAAPRGRPGGTTSAPPALLAPVRPGEAASAPPAAALQPSYTYDPNRAYERRGARELAAAEDAAAAPRTLLPRDGGQNLGQLILGLLSAAGGGIGGTVAGRFR